MRRPARTQQGLSFGKVKKECSRDDGEIGRHSRLPIGADRAETSIRDALKFGELFLAYSALSEVRTIQAALRSVQWYMRGDAWMVLAFEKVL